MTTGPAGRSASVPVADYVGPVAALVLLVALLAATIDAVGRRWWVPALAVVAAVVAEVVVVAVTRRSAVEPEAASPAGASPVPAPAPASDPAPEAASDPSSRLPTAPPPAPAPTPSATATPATDTPASAAALPAPQVMWVPKSTHRPDQHEDAWAIDPTGRRAAVADGASSAFMSREWAAILADAFVERPPDPGLAAMGRWVDDLSRSWEAGAAGSGDGGSWWAAESQRRGSAATLAGVVVDPPDPAAPGAGGRWRCWAVGDSCAVLVRLVGGRWQLARSFPLTAPEAFGAHPDLLATTSDGEADRAPAHLAWMEGVWLPGDQLILMTDAVAEWALRSDRAGQPVWDLLLRTGADWADVVARERGRGAMVDDDATVVRLPCR